MANNYCDTNCIRPAKEPVKPTPANPPTFDISITSSCGGGSGCGCGSCGSGGASYMKLDDIVADTDNVEISRTVSEETCGITIGIGVIEPEQFPDNFARITVKDGLSSFVQWTDLCNHLNFTGGEFEYTTYKGVLGQVTVPASVAPYDKGWCLYIDSERRRIGRSDDWQAVIDNPNYYIFGYYGEDDVDGVPVPAVFIDGYGWYPCPQAETPGCDVCISDIVAGEDSELVTVSYETDEETGERLYSIDVQNFPDNFARIVVDEGLSSFLTWTSTGSHVNFTGGEFKYHTYGGSSGVLRVPTAVSPFSTGWYLFFDTTTSRVGRAETLDAVLGREGTYVIGYMGQAEVDGWEDLTPAIYVDGYGWYPFLSEEMQNAHAKIAQIDDIERENPLSWGADGITVQAGTYPAYTYDGEFVGDYEIPTDTTLPFVSGQQICIDISGSGIVVADSMADLANQKNLYSIGKMNYVGGNRNVYLRGFGNYTDIPASLNSGNANIVGVPSTFAVTWPGSATINLPAGSYTMIESVTGQRTTIRTTAVTVLNYDFSSVVYYLPGGSTFLVAPTVSIPINAVVVGSMNNVNGLPTLFLNGLTSFPFTPMEG